MLMKHSLLDAFGDEASIKRIRADPVKMLLVLQTDMTTFKVSEAVVDTNAIALSKLVSYWPVDTPSLAIFQARNIYCCYLWLSNSLSAFNTYL